MLCMEIWPLYFSFFLSLPAAFSLHITHKILTINRRPTHSFHKVLCSCSSVDFCCSVIQFSFKCQLVLQYFKHDSHLIMCKLFIQLHLVPESFFFRSGIFFCSIKENRLNNTTQYHLLLLLYLYFNQL